jgi:succinate dehydrogenase/fumarate reductase flavoprotein subunit
MWNKVGVFRDRAGLQAALATLTPASERILQGVERGGSLDLAGWRCASLVTVGRLVARAALRREETRGAHSRTDFPRRDDVNFGRHLSDARTNTP